MNEENLELRSPDMLIRWGYDPLERAWSMFVGRPWGKDQILIAGAVHDLIMDGQGPLPYSEHMTVDRYMENLIAFFSTGGRRLLEGDGILLKEMFELRDKMAAQYTADLLRRQWMAKADKAWREKRYQDFVTMASQIDLTEVAGSYQLKLKIALREIEQQKE